MRIFNLDTIFSFALYPDGNKKRNRNSQSYCLTVDQYSKNGIDETDTETLKNHLKNMKVLCLGVLADEFKNRDQPELGAVKFRIKKTDKYEIKREFLSPNKNTPLPLFLFYKKKKAKVTKALTDILRPFFFNMINLYKGKNLEFKKIGISKKDSIEINYAYQNKITKTAEILFKKIEGSHPEVNIIGLFVDPYFIRKVDDTLFLEDTRPMDTFPRQNIPLLKEQSFLEGDQELIKPETDSNDLSASIFLSNTGKKNDIFESLDRVFTESVEEKSKNLLVTAEDGIAKEVVDAAQLDSGVDRHDTSVDLVTSRQEEIAASIPSISNPIATKSKSYNWNSKAKKEITDLLVGYQKHLSQKFFFRNNTAKIEKLFITEDLLEKIKQDTYKNFSDCLENINTKKILETHRDLPIIQKIGKFFKGHSKTEGTLLLENILSSLNENTIAINSMSV